jgi:hypothetical protein
MSRLKMKATEGMILTNGETYGREVFLGNGDSPDNWWEISITEYERKMQEEALKYEDIFPRT